MVRIFICYRHKDAPWPAASLYQTLRDHLTKASVPAEVFFDIDTIGAGEHFHKRIIDAIKRCDILLVVIGKKWLTLRSDKTGGRRLDDDDDFVRLEIQAGLKHRVQIIPILVDHAKMPKKTDLPEKLKKLAELHAVQAHQPDYLNVFAGKIESLARRLQKPRNIDQRGNSSFLVKAPHKEPASLTDHDQSVRKWVDQVLNEPQSPLVMKPTDCEEVEVLPPVDTSAFLIQADSRIIDLRTWKHVPDKDRHHPTSPVCCTRTVLLKKDRPTEHFEMEGLTTGLDLCWKCLSLYPSQSIGQSREIPVGSERMKARRLRIDVSDVPLREEIELHAAATFWNSHQAKHEQWSGVTGYTGANTVSMLLLFPAHRPFKNFRMMMTPLKSAKPVECDRPGIIFMGERREWLYWVVPNPLDKWGFQLHWDW
ncbi:MAG: toll/interleukin-1 receptor domain-containing protein [Planctomycetes bacterium]|nr:toll/interleukin-1 receptor domain-containing protein [Planctomycetota bacterium]